MAINSRAKGKRGELDLAAVLREFGYDAHRGQQFKGGGDSPDVTGLPGYHVEAKRVERGNLYEWMAQAIRDSAGTDKAPVVIHRRNGEEWVAILRLEDFLALTLTQGIADD